MFDLVGCLKIITVVRILLAILASGLTELNAASNLTDLADLDTLECCKKQDKVDVTKLSG